MELFFFFMDPSSPKLIGISHIIFVRSTQMQRKRDKKMKRERKERTNPKIRKVTIDRKESTQPNQRILDIGRSDKSRHQKLHGRVERLFR